MNFLDLPACWVKPERLAASKSADAQACSCCAEEALLSAQQPIDGLAPDAYKLADLLLG